MSHPPSKNIRKANLNLNDELIEKVQAAFNGSSFIFPSDEFDGKMAAVLVPLVRVDGEWALLFTRRSDELLDHKGEVSFPGGSVESQDQDFAQTALREAWEEVGLPSQKVQILGAMDVFHTISNFCLKPVIGVIQWPMDLTNNPAEVVRTFWIPIHWLVDSKHWKEIPRRLSNGRTETVIIYDDFDGETLWGITARITHEFLKAIKQMPE